MIQLNTWPEPKGWLYGFIDTTAPGYRKLNTGGADLTVAAGYHSFPAYVAQVNALSGVAASVDDIGRVTITGAAPMTWTDRLGWMLGLDVKPGDNSGSSASRISDRPPPAGIPLISVSWSRIDRAVESTVTVDRKQRGHGYLFGDNDLFRFRLLLHVQSLRSFREGCCLSGKVIISTQSPTNFASDTAWSTSNTDGYIEGYVIGVERGRWVDSTQTLWQAELIVSGA
tara:strand:+ start:7103 stop:7783 length:681 start_codon:yes stop_codon:yes gene_type:complete